MDKLHKIIFGVKTKIDEIKDNKAIFQLKCSFGAENSLVCVKVGFNTPNKYKSLLKVLFNYQEENNDTAAALFYAIESAISCIETGDKKEVLEFLDQLEDYLYENQHYIEKTKNVEIEKHEIL